MEVTMHRISSALFVLALPAALGACYRSEPQRDTRVIIQQQPQPQQTVALAPGPPPTPRAELVPPPPQGTGPVIWRPGHWVYTGIAGNEWSWQPGQYMSPPVGETTWVPGHWVQQPNGGWYWVDGHWA